METDKQDMSKHYVKIKKSSKDCKHLFDLINALKEENAMLKKEILKLKWMATAHD